MARSDLLNLQYDRGAMEMMGGAGMMGGRRMSDMLSGSTAASAPETRATIEYRGRVAKELQGSAGGKYRSALPHPRSRGQRHDGDGRDEELGAASTTAKTAIGDPSSMMVIADSAPRRDSLDRLPKLRVPRYGSPRVTLFEPRRRDGTYAPGLRNAGERGHSVQVAAWQRDDLLLLEVVKRGVRQETR